MEATVSSGTARRGFRRNMNAGDFAKLDMGGKTGSLTGHNPPGRYEWFIGYARHKDHPDQGIAVASQQIIISIANRRRIMMFRQYHGK
jgi:hypothetical protein